MQPFPSLLSMVLLVLLAFDLAPRALGLAQSSPPPRPALLTADGSPPLTVDPWLAYSTFLGGRQGDEATGIAVDGQGNAYVVGNTGSDDFPGVIAHFGVSGSCFVTKLNPAGTGVIYSTVIGPGTAHGIAVDANGDAYIVGTTFSGVFPVTPNALQSTNAGGADAFVAKLSPDGSQLLYATTSVATMARIQAMALHSTPPATCISPA